MHAGHSSGSTLSTEPPIDHPRPLGGILSLFSFFDKPSKINNFQDLHSQDFKIDKQDQSIYINDHDGELLSFSWRSISTIAPFLSSAIKVKNSKLYIDLCRSIGDTKENYDNNYTDNNNEYSNIPHSDICVSGDKNFSSNTANALFNASVITSSVITSSTNNPSFDTNNLLFGTKIPSFGANIPTSTTKNASATKSSPSSTKLLSSSTKLSPSSTKSTSSNIDSTPLPSISSYFSNTKLLSAIDINTHLNSIASPPNLKAPKGNVSARHDYALYSRLIISFLSCFF
jgi:hypothetical protein